MFATSLLDAAFIRKVGRKGNRFTRESELFALFDILETKH